MSPGLLLGFELVELLDPLAGLRRLLRQLCLLLHQLDLRLLQVGNLRIHRRLHLLIDEIFLANGTDVLPEDAVRVRVQIVHAPRKGVFFLR